MSRGWATMAAGLAVTLGSPVAAAGSVSHELADPSGGKQATLDYWTAKRMRAAEPRALDRAAPSSLTTAPSASAAAIPPGSIPASDPTVGRAAVEPRARAQTGIVPGDAFEVTDPGRPPNTVHGKVFGKDRVGTFQCSATAVTSANLSVLFTAGHCVHLKPYGWARKFVFVPSYSHGRAPFGSWAAEVIWVSGKWVHKQHENYDMAAVVVAPQGGVEVQEAVGGAGFAWNQPREQTYSSFGYPSNFFSGERMMGCRSTLRHRTIDSGKGPAMVAMSCDMGQGSSGGGWLIGDGVLASVQSLGGPRKLAAGPYFGKTARRLLLKAQAE